MKKNIQELLNVSQGHKKADLRIDNAQIVDVHGGEIFSGSLCVHEGIIISYEKLDAEKVLDAENKFIIPGLFDSHVHIESSMLTPEAFDELILPFGTTSIIADPHEIANVAGIDGIKFMMASAERAFFDAHFMLPSCVPALPFEYAGAMLSAQDLAELMPHDAVQGLGEMMNVPGVLMQDTDVLAKLELAQRYQKNIDGHCPGLADGNLDSYTLAGIQTDHELTTVEELKARIRRGMYVLLREGSAARNLLALIPALNESTMRFCLLCTDDRHSADIYERGHINGMLRTLVENGIDPINAIRMASLNAAECYGLKHKGSLAIGKEATFLIVNSLQEFAVQKVFCKGELCAEEGQYRAKPSQNKKVQHFSDEELARLSQKVLSSMNFDVPKDLNIKINSGLARLIRVQEKSLLTDCVLESVSIDENNHFSFTKEDGIIKIAVVERHKNTGKVGLGLLHKQYGLKNGAIATSIAHDSHNIVVAGDNDADILLALERIKDLKGGIVMVSSGQIIGELALPCGGLMTQEKPRKVADDLLHLLKLAKNHYQIWDGADAFMTLSFLALPVIPEIKITPAGLFDVNTFQFVDIDAKI